MKLNQILVPFIALVTSVSCSSDNESKSLQTQVTFNDIEQKLEMKGSFSELSKKNILRHYKTTDNFLKLALKRKEELSVKKNTQSQKTEKMMQAHTVKVQDPYYDVTIDFWCWDDEIILDKYLDLGRRGFDCDGVGMSPACVAKLIGGKVDQSDQSFLNDDEMEAGWVIVCRAYPASEVYILMRQEENFVPI